MSETPLSAAQCLACLELDDAAVRRALTEVYGTDRDVLGERILLLRSVLSRFIDRFGDRPVRLFRSPGRINLRGMHVDTHGGYLNLMTHQREIVLAVSPTEKTEVVFSNVDPRYPDARFDIEALRSQIRPGEDWQHFITRPDVRTEVEFARGEWSNYLKGAFLSVAHRLPGCAIRGVRAVVGSDVPRGASLSSSAALCTAACQAIVRLNALHLDEEQLILAARDAEWYTGSRCGLSDQTAIVLARKGELLNLALNMADFHTRGARRLTFPEDLSVLVVDSFTERSLSGAAHVAYTVNRFAYSLAMEILRQEVAAQGVGADTVSKIDRLSVFTPENLEPFGGSAFLLRLLRGIPARISIDDLRTRYNLPDLDSVYEQYFGSVPEGERPREVALRGPLLFGIAESERARIFPELLERGDYLSAGRLMSLGHDGDRKYLSDGTPYAADTGDDAMDRLIARAEPIHCSPGAYGASSRVLDFLVDAARQAGALGACLTGAGIAGTILALCRREDAQIVAQILRDKMTGEDYPRVAFRSEPLSEEELRQAVVPNAATAAAGELSLARSSTEKGDWVL